MTLPSRLVSILLVYCFVVASVAPQTISAQSAGRVKSNSSGDILDRGYNFLTAHENGTPMFGGICMLTPQPPLDRVDTSWVRERLAEIAKLIGSRDEK